MAKEEVMIQVDFGIYGIFEFPARLIAASRAKYYALNDPDTTYEEEYKYTIGSDSELYDWFRNNMSWADVEACAALVAHGEIDYDDLLNDADIEIVR